MVSTFLYYPGQCLQGQLKYLDGSQVPQNTGSTIFQKKRPTFEIHRTSDASMGSVAFANLAYGLYQISTSQITVCKVN